MNQLQTNQIKKLIKNLSDDDLKQAAREVLVWFNTFEMDSNSHFSNIAEEIVRITDCGDYIKFRMAENGILEEATRRYVEQKKEVDI